MRKSFFLRLVLLNTFKKRIRAFLVVGGIAVTTSAMIVLFGVSGGLHNLVDAQIKNGDAKDVVTVDQRNLTQIKLNQQKVSDVASVSGVGDVEQSVAIAGNLSSTNVAMSIPVYGVTKGYFGIAPFKVTEGDQTQLSGNNIIVSTKVVEALGLSEKQAVGTTIQASLNIPKAYASKQDADSATSNQDNFNIVAVIDKGENTVAYFPLEYAQLQGIDSVSQLKIRTTSTDKVATVREAVEQMGFKTSSIQDTVDQIDKIFTVIQKTLLIFGIIVFLLTVSATFTVITLTLMEEMKQIGFLRVSGLRNRDVKVLFVMQSILLTTLGAVSGVILGLLAGGVVNAMAANAASGAVFTGTVTVFSVPSFQIGLVVLLSIGIGWLVGLLPARRAVTLQPLEEMKL